MRIALLCVTLSVTACLGSSEPLASDTGVVVRVTLWPVNPVEIAGQPAATRPAVDARVVARGSDGREEAAARTDDDGIARLLVAPGDYTIVVEECPGAMSLPKENAEVSVSAGSFARADLTCDTGIR